MAGILKELLDIAKNKEKAVDSILILSSLFGIGYISNRIYFGDSFLGLKLEDKLIESIMMSLLVSSILFFGIHLSCYFQTRNKEITSVYERKIQKYIEKDIYITIGILNFVLMLTYYGAMRFIPQTMLVPGDLITVILTNGPKTIETSGPILAGVAFGVTILVKGGPILFGVGILAFDFIEKVRFKSPDDYITPSLVLNEKKISIPQRTKEVGYMPDELNPRATSKALASVSGIAYLVIGTVTKRSVSGIAIGFAEIILGSLILGWLFAKLYNYFLSKTK